jgi:hypothetical protein
MLPNHCRNVSVRNVNYELKQENIEKELLDSNIYKGTDYLILNNADTWAIVRIGKTPLASLFWKVTSVEIVAVPENTVFYTDPEVDVLNKNSMAEALEKFPGKTVVVKGKFEHVSFITPEPIVTLNVLEVVPPEPPKLSILISELLKFESFSKPVKFTEHIINIESMIEKKDKSQILLFPCRTSGSSDEVNNLFLDEMPELNSSLKDRINLVGCELSLKIFREVYGFSPRFINICPTKLAIDQTFEGPVLIKCCKAKSFERQDNLLIVPWGVTYIDLKEALNELLSN